jgi:hypothetical protein
MLGGLVLSPGGLAMVVCLPLARLVRYPACHPLYLVVTDR